MPDRQRIWSENELDAALAGFRADAGPDAATLRRLRRRVTGTAGDVGVGAAFPAGAAERAVPRGRPAPGGRAFRWLAAAAAAAAVVATVSGVAAVTSGGGAAPAASPVPAAPPAPPVDGVPVPAAELGRHASDLDVAPGQYLYRRTEYAAGPFLQEWIPHDRSGTWLLRGSPDSEVGELRSASGEYFGPRGDSWQQPSQEFLAGLPRDPDALAALLQSDVVRRAAPYPDAPDHAALVAVASLLRRTAVPADLRAALYAALDRVPGIRAHLEDGGRRGVLGVEWDADGARQRYELLVDPASGRMSGERTGAPGSGSTVSWGVADALGVPPAG
ncbi:hypothetical protein [Pseudonocardia kunmingensis]|uniref:CU044_5270 family protein n=1 Tax=Pseudonocardia kunmingensis TaxID=630975 RepID=A0A543DRU7_9PSEU|nr:hypothetical protein [Pseudonocardia kunmingensis]TQM12060.1 hypothetical protein FB558_4637 [Pseudonocardia kunmingensis]